MEHLEDRSGILATEIDTGIFHSFQKTRDIYLEMYKSKYV
jgi:hypothetical protein